MNKINKFLMGCSVVLLAGCASDDFMGDLADSGKAGTVTFTITTNDSEIGVITRSGENDSKTISDMIWLVSDTEGNIFDHHYGKLDNDFSKLTLEGLKYGDYNLIFLATLEGSDNALIESPCNFTDSWLTIAEGGKPIDGYYCYKKVPFSVGSNGTNVDVILEHSASKVCVDVDLPNESLWRHIKRVTVNFNEEVPAGMNAGGSYIGSANVTDYDIYNPNGDLSFTTFPSETPVSGYVEIESSREDADNFIERYEFSGLKLEAGKIAHININYRHPERETGLLYVSVQEQWRHDIRTMLLADEPREVFYNNSERGFYTTAPLQIWIRDDSKLAVRYYSPYTLKDVRVKARFNKISSEWVDLAVIEEVNPFEEAFFTLPVTQKDCVFDGESGRKIKIPAMPNLSPADVTLKFEWDKNDAFMNKVAEIKYNWYIRFSPYGADAGHASWRHMTPLLCRFGIGLAYDMTYMFSSPEFPEEFKNWEGKLVDNDRIITLEEIQTRLNRHAGLLMGRVEGVLGLGGGQTFGMTTDRYTDFYPDATPVGGNTFNGARQTVFHEFAHCLDYSHNGNMTYGQAWTVLCAKVLVELGWADRLPVSRRSDITRLPMESSPLEPEK